jgi:nucleotide-binding universal stress UspA family protein
MTRYDKILVCIDRLEHAAPIFQYVQGTARQFDSKEISIVHVPPAPPPVPEAPPAAETGTRITAEQILALAHEHMPGTDKDMIRADVLTGQPLLEILRLAHDRDADLIVLERRYGRMDDEADEAILAERIARKAHCSVLVLPDTFKINAANILVPVRDSECSGNALEEACEIANKIPARVIALNVFQVGASGYSRVGTTFDEHHQLIREAAVNESQSLLQKVDTHGASVKSVCSPDLQSRPVPVILDAANRHPADLIVIGARGRTGAAGVLLGSVTEKLIQGSPVPVLAVKKKGECLGVLRALLTLAAEG